jgi:DNA-binding HxlR family transcriptional regulator
MAETLELTGALNPRSGWDATRCSLAKALEVVSTRSAFLLLREAFYGTERFDDFAARVGVSDPVAAARLKQLVEHGLLVREPYREPGQRTRYAYRLSEMGADLFPSLVALMQWGDRWLAEDGPPVEVRHSACGATVHAELRCERGHEVALGELELARPDRDDGRPTRARPRSSGPR